MTLIVSANDNFSDPTSTISGTWAANSTTVFEKPEEADWSNKYFKLVYNVTTGSTNQYAQFVKAEFYKETGTTLLDSDLSLSPTELSFDFYNDSEAKTITISTSSTGAISVSDNDYVTCELNGNTITVTPLTNITPQPQTITVSQAADDNYSAGSATFTFEITDSTPFTGGNVTFDATVDKGINSSGSGSITKNVVTFACTSCNLSDGAAYRLYSGSTTTISTTSGVITGISFTMASNYASTLLSTTTGTYSEGTWSGNAESVSFSASAQARVTEIVVTVAAPASVATPTFSVTGGVYTSEQSVEISCETEDATIYYTTDGTDPDNESAQYTAAITISQTTTLKAIAILNEESSYVAEATYTIVTIEHAGTEADPYTVADARNAIDANTGKTGVYATGIVSKIETEWSTQYNNITFNFVDNEDDTDFLQAYRCVSGTGVDASQVAVGDVVVVYGDLTKYSSTYEFGSGCQLVSLVHTVAGDDSGQATLNGIDAGMTYVVPSGVTLTFTGTNNGTASNLIIEDGGQLIHTEAVDATLQKDIASYSSKGVSGWYTVASPVNGAPVSTLTSGTYDLYSYDEASHYWWNQQGTAHSFTTLSRGQGYLYANSADKVVSFAGSMESTSATVEVTLSKQDGTSLAGYNLVGNPFTRNLTSTDVIKIGGSTDLNTYYFVAGGSELESTTIGERDIKAGEGFFVQASADGEKLTFNYSAKGETAAKPAYVCIEAGDESFMDRAYVQVGQGNTLRKMTLNDNVAHVYVLHNEADYAAATIEAAEGEMPVCFKAAHDGQYTLNVNTKGLDADYLHLIDNFTGADIDLIASPSYTFDAKAADHACRFRLMFDASENNGASTLATAFAYLSNGEIVITGAEADATLQIMDMTGRVVAIRDAARNVSTAGMPAGVYVLRLVNGSDVKTQKMVIR